MMLNYNFISWLIPKILFEIVDPGTATIIGSSLIGGGSLLEGLLGGKEQEYPFEQETKDYYNYAKAKERETRLKIDNMLNKTSYESFPGQKNLSTMAQGTVRSMMDKPPPDYFGQANEYLKTGATTGKEVEPYAPYADQAKSKDDYTEWDKIAEDNGIVVTKYNDFNSQAEIQQVLFDKNKASVEVTANDVVMANKASAWLLNQIRPGLGDSLNAFCELGQCDLMYAEFIRTIKGINRTRIDMKGNFDAFAQAKDNISAWIENSKS